MYLREPISKGRDNGHGEGQREGREREEKRGKRGERKEGGDQAPEIFWPRTAPATGLCSRDRLYTG